ncbi:MAG: Rieske 2Fe-2S domain-containing protein [Halieaceae bacterium]|nr:Rieske 2Fe-2S domain-containing protein [Halieaceae bacterium]
MTTARDTGPGTRADTDPGPQANDSADNAANSLPLATNTSMSVTIDGRDLILADRDGAVFAYDNACPHTGETLDPMGGSVSEAGGALLRCQRHAAEFDVATGECVGGPCIGERLTPVAVTVVGREIYLD